MKTQDIGTIQTLLDSLMKNCQIEGYYNGQCKDAPWEEEVNLRNKEAIYQQKAATDYKDICKLLAKNRE